jgi:hypothetical protein
MTLATELSREERYAATPEEELWRKKRALIQAQGTKLLPQTFEFGRSGRLYRRVDTLHLRQPINAGLRLQDFHARLLSVSTLRRSHTTVRWSSTGYMNARAEARSVAERQWLGVAVSSRYTPFASDANH